jgi:hypothetical protein
MDVEKDHELFWIAKEGLKAPLPKDWKPCKTQDTEEIYYFNFSTGDSTWDHPCDDYYRGMYEEHKNKAAASSGKEKKKSKREKKKKTAKQQTGANPSIPEADGPAPTNSEPATTAGAGENKPTEAPSGSLKTVGGGLGELKPLQNKLDRKPLLTKLPAAGNLQGNPDTSSPLVPMGGPSVPPAGPSEPTGPSPVVPGETTPESNNTNLEPTGPPPPEAPEELPPPHAVKAVSSFASKKFGRGLGAALSSSGAMSSLGEGDSGGGAVDGPLLSSSTRGESAGVGLMGATLQRETRLGGDDDDTEEPLLGSTLLGDTVHAPASSSGTSKGARASSRDARSGSREKSRSKSSSGSRKSTSGGGGSSSSSNSAHRNHGDSGGGDCSTDTGTSSSSSLAAYKQREEELVKSHALALRATEDRLNTELASELDAQRKAMALKAKANEAKWEEEVRTAEEKGRAAEKTLAAEQVERAGAERAKQAEARAQLASAEAAALKKELEASKLAVDKAQGEATQAHVEAASARAELAEEKARRGNNSPGGGREEGGGPGSQAAAAAAAATAEAVAAAKKVADKALAAVRAECEEKLAAREEAHCKELATVRGDAETVLRKARAEFEAEIAQSSAASVRLTELHEMALADATRKGARVEAEAEGAVSDLSAKHAAEVASLEAQLLVLRQQQGQQQQPRQTARSQTKGIGDHHDGGGGDDVGGTEPLSPHLMGGTLSSTGGCSTPLEEETTHHVDFSLCLSELTMEAFGTTAAQEAFLADITAGLNLSSKSAAAAAAAVPENSPPNVVIGDNDGSLPDSSSQLRVSILRCCAGSVVVESRVSGFADGGASDSFAAHCAEEFSAGKVPLDPGKYGQVAFDKPFTCVAVSAPRPPDRAAPQAPTSPPSEGGGNGLENKHNSSPGLDSPVSLLSLSSSRHHNDSHQASAAADSSAVAAAAAAIAAAKAEVAVLQAEVGSKDGALKRCLADAKAQEDALVELRGKYAAAVTARDEAEVGKSVVRRQLEEAKAQAKRHTEVAAEAARVQVVGLSTKLASLRVEAETSAAKAAAALEAEGEEHECA